MVSNYFQISVRLTIKNQLGIGQRIVVDQPVQFRPLVHTVCHLVLHGSAVDGEQRPIIHAQLHAGGIQVKLTGHNLSHSRYLPMLEFRLIFRKGTRGVSVVLDTGKQCVWIATHTTGKQCEC